MELMVKILQTTPIWQLSIILLVENIIIFGLALYVGQFLIRIFRARPVALPPPRIDWFEITLVVVTLILNTVVTVVGLMLWRRGIINFRVDTGLRAWLDIPILIMVMDFAMYFLHRIAHFKIFFPLLHRTHHNYDRPRPLTLFALNPAEAISFGALWLVVVSVYDASWLGMSVYLAINVAFGTIGHLGVEPLPNSWLRVPVVNYISTSTFHAQHHQDLNYNYGFYTLIWDRLFKTLSPRYQADFGRILQK